MLFIYSCLFLFFLRLQGYVYKLFYIFDKGTKEEQAAPRTTEPRIRLSPTSGGG